MRLAIDVRKNSGRNRALPRRFFPVERAHGESGPIDHPVHGKGDQVLDKWKIPKLSMTILLRMSHSSKNIEKGDDDKGPAFVSIAKTH